MTTHLLPEDDSFDRSLFMIGMLSIAFMWIILVYYWPGLPEQIPSHFNSDGEVDGYSSKYILILLPMVGTATWGLIQFFGNKPHLYNFPVKITEENRIVQYKLAKRLLTILNASTAMMLLYVEFAMIQAALGKNFGLSLNIVFIIGGWITFICLMYFYLAKRNK
jgi:uncharacterized membrane protein